MTASFDIRNSAFEISPIIASEQKLLMMRPYQVYQVKNIVQCIHDNCGNGTIRHTSSSDKTSSKENARRVSVDSANQFNKFQEGCVEENTNTAALVRRLLSNSGQKFSLN